MDLTTRLEIEGMMCQASCGATVESALNDVIGVESAEASYARSEAIVKWRSDTLKNENLLVDAVEAVGFGASIKFGTRILKLSIQGMMCQASCGTTVRSALLGVKGCRSAQVSYPLGCAEVEIDENVNENDLVQAVEAVGFDAAVLYTNDKNISLLDTTQAATTPIATMTTKNEMLAKSEVAVRGTLTRQVAQSIKTQVEACRGVRRCDMSLGAARMILSHEPSCNVATLCRTLQLRGCENISLQMIDDDDDDDDQLISSDGSNLLLLKVDENGLSQASANDIVLDDDDVDFSDHNDDFDNNITKRIIANPVLEALLEYSEATGQTRIELPLGLVQDAQARAQVLLEWKQRAAEAAAVKEEEKIHQKNNKQHAAAAAAAEKNKEDASSSSSAAKKKHQQQPSSSSSSSLFLLKQEIDQEAKLHYLSSTTAIVLLFILFSVVVYWQYCKIIYSCSLLIRFISMCL
mmetsp:Transcript_8116/g.12410  ORF Transcript_8116/g.12410 Transcript_8116/m.12410 type:complete len:464 (-) Transcript_8116:36-1427(-)